MNRTLRPLVAALLLAAALAGAVAAKRAPAPATPRPNTLTRAEAERGWILLFDGATHTGWRTSSGTPSRTPIRDGTLNPHGAGGYMLIHERQWSNFILSLEFKLSPKCNSGVFFRTFPLTPRSGKDVGFNGLEVAIDDTTTAGYHDTGAIYDLAKPSRNAMKPAGEWNRLDLYCRGSDIRVAVNGELVTQMDLNEFREPFLRPDGTRHKFDFAPARHPRRGYIGLQDHGSDCWYRNIKLLPL